MKNFIHYCPKCGEKLIDRSNHVKKFFILVCDKCKYSLTDSSIVDISFKSKGIAKALSNLCPYPFEFDGVACSSMEAFIQSLKVEDVEVQKDICSKTGPFCYSIREMHDDWRETQTVYWKGKRICRHGDEYFELIRKAYEALINQSPLYYYALKKAKDNGYILQHSIGCKDSSETLLTEQEFIKALQYLIKHHIK